VVPEDFDAVGRGRDGEVLRDGDGEAGRSSGGRTVLKDGDVPAG
jgi:hypothetical protein